MVKVENVMYDYPGYRALNNVSFELREGSVTALVGPNGAGKTTLLRCLAALSAPHAGNIWLQGADIFMNPQESHRQIGYLSDFFGLYDDLTVEQNLMFMAHAQKLGELAEERVNEVTKLLGLESYLYHYAKSLSRGWRQRLGIAMSIIHHPTFLILDEPASGLDPEARIHLSGLVRRLSESGITLIVSSHILAELEDYSTDLLVMSQGSIVQSKSIGNTGLTGKRMFLTMAGSPGNAYAILEAFPGVQQVQTTGEDISFTFDGDKTARALLLKRLVSENVPVAAFAETKVDLQAEYIETMRNHQTNNPNHNA